MAPPAYLSPLAAPTTPVSTSPPSLNTSTASSLSNTSSTSTSPAVTPTAPAKKKGSKRAAAGQQQNGQQGGGGPAKKAKVSRYFLLAPGCTQDDYSKKGAKPGKPRKNDKHLPVDIRWVPKPIHM